MSVLKKWKKSFIPRLTLDTKKDYLLLKEIFNHFNKKKKNIYFNLQEIMKFLDANKKIINLNRAVGHKIPTGL